jgi:hypothetical protein
MVDWRPINLCTLFRRLVTPFTEMFSAWAIWSGVYSLANATTTRKSAGFSLRTTASDNCISTFGGNPCASSGAVWGLEAKRRGVAWLSKVVAEMELEIR